MLPFYKDIKNNKLYRRKKLYMYNIESLIHSLVDTWEEMQKFGKHEGDCTFSTFCKECGRPLDCCELHYEKMKERTEKMQEIVDQLKKYIN